MTPFWRRPGALMSAYFVLVLATGPWTPQAAMLTGRHPAGYGTVPAVAIAAFLAWRVTRGSAIARGILVVWTVLGFAAVFRSPAMASGSLVPFCLLVSYSGQIALLLSEPVYNRTRKNRADETGEATAARLWPAPPVWMLPTAVAVGAVLALVTLGSMSFKPVQGCQAPGYLAPDSAPLASCYTLTQGYPVPYLTALPSLSLNKGSKITASNLDLFANAVISKGALIEDLAAWTLASAACLFILWIPRRRPESSPVTVQAVPA